MPDTMTRGEGASSDTRRCACSGLIPRYRLTKEAADRAKHHLGLRRYEDLAAHLGVSRSSLFRMLAGTHPITLGQAAHFAGLISWPIDRTFERCDP